MKSTTILQGRELSLTDLTVLGLVAEAKRKISGIELENIITKRNMRSWTDIGKSSVYHSLKSLEIKSFLRKFRKTTKRSDNKPPIMINKYEITNEGKKQLIRDLLISVKVPEKLINPFDIALSNLIELSEDEILLQALQERLQQLQDKITFLERELHHYNSLQSYGYDMNGNPTQDRTELKRICVVFLRPLAAAKCEYKWVQDFINEIKTDRWWLKGFSSD